MRLVLLTRGRLVQPLMDGFISQGCEIVHQPRVQDWDFRGCDYLLMYGPMYPIGDTIRLLADLPQSPPVIFWYTEQVPPPFLPTWLTRWQAESRFAARGWYDLRVLPWVKKRWGEQHGLPGMGRLRGVGEMLALQETGRLRLICAFTQTNTRFLACLGLPVVELPIGCHPHFGTLLNLERDIDVVFLGTLRDARRKRLLKKLEQRFSQRGINLVIYDGSAQRGYCFDDERTQLLNRAKIMLNIMRQPWDDPYYRMLLAAANGVLLLSEPIWESSHGPFIPGQHLVACAPQEMALMAEHLLTDESARKVIIERVSTLITGSLAMSQQVGMLLREIGEA